LDGSIGRSRGFVLQSHLIQLSQADKKKPFTTKLDHPRPIPTTL
jgi:hypothetical protein